MAARKPHNTTTTQPETAPEPQRSRTAAKQGHRITPAADRAIQTVAAKLGLPVDALVDLAVRDWCRAWDPDLL